MGWRWLDSERCCSSRLPGWPTLPLEDGDGNASTVAGKLHPRARGWALGARDVAAADRSHAVLDDDDDDDDDDCTAAGEGAWVGREARGGAK